MKNNISIIYIDLEGIVRNDILWGLIELQIDVVRSNIVAPINTVDYDAVGILTEEIKKYDLAISQNFSSTIAEACHVVGVPYISWIYDCPQVAAFNKEALYPECYKFMFDKAGAERLIRAGVKGVYHQPLAANIALSSRVNMTKDDVKKYQSDISLVGQIYYSGVYSGLYEAIPDFMQKDFDKVILENKLRWYGNSIYGMLSKAEIEAIYNVMDKSGLDQSVIPIDYLLDTLVFSYHIAGEERKDILNISSDIADTVLYTHNPDRYTNILRCRCSNPVDSESDIYKVYSSSKINLNVTLHSIETGVPQRVFDIMSVGGFVLSNFQEEIGELFEIGKDIAVYKSIEEYVDKAKYYLTHDEERTRVGENGYLRVRENYTYPKILKKMLGVVLKEL